MAVTGDSSREISCNGRRRQMALKRAAKSFLADGLSLWCDAACLKDKRRNEMRRTPIASIVLIGSVSVLDLAVPQGQLRIRSAWPAAPTMRCVAITRISKNAAPARRAVWAIALRIPHPTSMRMRAIADQASRSSIDIDAPARAFPAQIIVHRLFVAVSMW